MPDSLLPNRSSHVLLGASSISLTRSSKYVGWLFGLSIAPCRRYCNAVSALHDLPSAGRDVFDVPSP